jgi:cathepsin L
MNLFGKLYKKYACNIRKNNTMLKTLLFAISILRIFAEPTLRARELTELKEQNNDYEWKEFSHFQEKFSKRYSNLEELEKRFKIFRENLRDVIMHNLDWSQNFTMGINQFSDLTSDEFKNTYVRNSFQRQPLGSFGCKPYSSNAAGAPNQIDWRDFDAVNPVRDQGQCGSCWAFATTANAESVWAIQKGELYDLSEEYLVDCASGMGYFNMGCNGGTPDSAFKYMINNGQCYEELYPYTAGVTKTAGKCTSCTSTPVKFSGCLDVAPNDQISLKAAVAINPVAVAIEADTRYFQSYAGGILDSPQCGTTLDHAVEIIGYGTDNGIDYWNVRNSWGTTWGESGYFRVKRTSATDDIGICGIAAEPSFLVV